MAVAGALEVYDSDKMFPVLGFGARVPGPAGTLTAPQHAFPVYSGGLEVHGLQGILQVRC